MPHRSRPRNTTYLVALSRESRSNGEVFAVRARNAAAALEAIRVSQADGRVPVIVGSLSTRVAKAIGVKPGDVVRV